MLYKNNWLTDVCLFHQTHLQEINVQFVKLFTWLEFCRLDISA
jgi:hypothetical protein